MKESIDDRMADRIQDALSAFGEIRSVRVYRAHGYWTHLHQDVMPFQGWANVSGQDYSFGSWDTLGACERRGFTVEDARGKYRAEVDFYLHAKERRRT